jgi:hypothetical protein
MDLVIRPRNLLGKVSAGSALTMIVVLAVTIATRLSNGELVPSKGGLILLVSGMTFFAISAIGALATGFIAIMKRRERSITVFIAVLVSLLGIVSLAGFIWGSPSKVSNEKIIEYFLAGHALEGRYHVFEPEMSLPDWVYIENIRSELRYQGLPLDKLVEKFSETNRKPVLMDIPSSIERGYVIDYSKKYASYFEEDGSGWIGLRQENPQVQALVSLSVPAYDPSTGLVMIYVGWLGDSLFGEGDIFVYKYIFGEMILVTSLVEWIS